MLGAVQEGIAEAEWVLGFEARQRLAKDDTGSAAPAELAAEDAPLSGVLPFTDSRSRDAGRASSLAGR